MSETDVWWLIAGLGVVTYLIRFSFLGLLAGRRVPGWLTEVLGFVPVTVLPALVAPMVVMQDGQIAAEPARLAGAAVGVALGAGLGNVAAAIAGAMATFAVLTALGV